MLSVFVFDLITATLGIPPNREFVDLPVSVNGASGLKVLQIMFALLQQTLHLDIACKRRSLRKSLPGVRDDFDLPFIFVQYGRVANYFLR